MSAIASKAKLTVLKEAGQPDEWWYDRAMHTYLLSWLFAFITLGAAVLGTAVFYRSFGDGLDLNGPIAETITALIVVAAEAGGFVLEKHFPAPANMSFHSEYSVMAAVCGVSIWLGYKLTHLTSWDPLEYLVVGCFQLIATGIGWLIIAQFAWSHS